MADQENTPPESKAPAGPDRQAAPVKEGDLVFYYSRSRRLERASPAVRALNDPTPVKRPGFFRTLTATKGHATLFYTILLLSGVMLLLSYLNNHDRGVTLGGNRLSVSAMGFPGEASGITYIAFKKQARGEGAYTGTVDLGISVPLSKEAETSGPDAPIATQRFFFTLEQEEEFRFSVPFTGPVLLLVIRTAEEERVLRIKTE